MLSRWTLQICSSLGRLLLATGRGFGWIAKKEMAHIRLLSSKLVALEKTP